MMIGYCGRFRLGTAPLRFGWRAPIRLAQGWKQARTLLFLGLVGSLQAAPLRVIDETAIPYMSFLAKADFDQRYPGELVEASAALDSGWYVIYQHEALNYYFGPVLLESIGQDYLEQLTETVEAAVAERPSIQNYRLELSYEPKEPEETNPEADSSPPSESASPNPLPPPNPPKPSFWGFIRRIFGFG
mgnify:CR=1 FL=1